MLAWKSKVRTNVVHGADNLFGLVVPLGSAGTREAQRNVVCANELMKKVVTEYLTIVTLDDSYVGREMSSDEHVEIGYNFKHIIF